MPTVSSLARLDSAATLIGRTGILRKFRAARPQKDEKINAYFARLCEYRLQLAGTAEAISDEELRTHVYTNGTGAIQNDS